MRLSWISSSAPSRRYRDPARPEALEKSGVCGLLDGRQGPINALSVRDLGGVGLVLRAFGA